MKINLRRIISDHVLTLRHDGKGKISVFDIVLFYGFPVVSGVLTFKFICLDPDVYNAGLSFYGIFIGLLINVQVAMFSIFQRKWTPLEDNLSEEARLESVQRRNVLLKEANANISYLIVICCIAATVSIILLVQRAQCGWGPAICAGLTSHFLLTLMMIVKRLHALFAREYEER